MDEPAAPPAPETVVSRPRYLFRPDPVLGWRLTPRRGVRPRFRKAVVQTIDATGWRHVPGRPARGPRLGLYGCSFTYGTGLADAETFAARLQVARPGLRVLNRGIGGHGTVQNLLQLRRDLAAGAVDMAVFAVIGDHRFRNVPHPARMRAYLSMSWQRLGVEHVPVARQAPDGRLRIGYVPIWQPALRAASFDAFLPDDPMLIRTTCAVLDRARDEAGAAGVPFRAVLLDRVEPAVTRALAALRPGTVDASVPYDADHHFLPEDAHPNPRANALYAERLVPVADALLAERGA